VNKRLILSLVSFLMAPACPNMAVLINMDLIAQETSANTSAKQPLPAPSIRVEASPRFQLAQIGKPASVLIRVRVPQNPQNRAVCVLIDGPMYRSSCWESPQGGAAGKEFRYSSLSAGEYELVGVVEWVDEANGERKTTVTRDRFTVSDGQSSID
jgi:hypothetical protein